MADQHKEQNDHDVSNREQTSHESGHRAEVAHHENTGDRLGGIAYDPDSTTGSGISELERTVQDGTASREASHLGSEELIEKYNINDQAHSDSSLEDFVKTTSAFKHADDAKPDSPGTL